MFCINFPPRPTAWSAQPQLLARSASMGVPAAYAIVFKTLVQWGKAIALNGVPVMTALQSLAGPQTITVSHRPRCGSYCPIRIDVSRSPP